MQRRLRGPEITDVRDSVGQARRKRFLRFKSALHCAAAAVESENDMKSGENRLLIGQPTGPTGELRICSVVKCERLRWASSLLECEAQVEN